MSLVALSCPQCAAPLPKQAWWRMVTCPYCQAVVTKSAKVVHRAWFQAACGRIRPAFDDAAPRISIGPDEGQQFRILAHLGSGTSAGVYLGERVNVHAERVILKVADAEAGAAALRREADVLEALQRLDGPGAAWFTRQLPQAAGLHVARDWNRHSRQVLVQRHPPGFWGSLDRVIDHQPGGVDARHVVWMWRRVLATLGFIHERGWHHGDLAPDHLLVHPRDHGILVIGWSRAAQAAPALRSKAAGRDHAQAAWSMRMLLHGPSPDTAPPIPDPVPAPLADLLRRCSEDAAWCSRAGAAGIDAALREAAIAAFGAPRFIPFHPTRASAMS